MDRMKGPEGLKGVDTQLKNVRFFDLGVVSGSFYIWIVKEICFAFRFIHLNNTDM